MGVGSWPLGVNFSASRYHLFLSLGVDFGFLGVDFESLGWILGLSRQCFWESGGPFWNPGSFLALEDKCMLLSFNAIPLGVNYGALGDNFWPP